MVHLQLTKSEEVGKRVAAEDTKLAFFKLFPTYIYVSF